MLQPERFAPFFLTRVVELESAIAWELQHYELDKKELTAIQSTQSAPAR